MVSIFLIIDDIKNIFLKNFGKIFTKNQIKLQVFSLIQIKIPEYFSYLDNTLKYIYTAYDEKKNILLDYFSLDVVSLIEKKSLQYSYICKIYKKLFNVNTKLLNDILGNNKKYFQIQQNNFTFIFDTIKKYFEYRMITYKENKLFGVLNYYDIIY